jgi:hypothetical protein
MTPASAWLKRAQAVDEARRKDLDDHELRVRRLLQSMVRWKLCHRSALHWLGGESTPQGRLHVSFKRGDAKVRDYHALTLNGLQHLKPGAVLSMSFVQDKRTQLLLGYSIGLRGLSSSSGRSWYARIDLDEEQKGEGPCSHPNLHCHVGNDPDGDDDPKARVPVPWLAPDEALTWLLATVDPRFEPQDLARSA